jgi:alkanesulfonate monooxygenase SsuD/methylene tetrahydromethanopterin reductase-like flavin-dependent oxidoreductase (luciferase family)
MRVGVVILPQFPVAETRRRWKSLEDRGFAHGWTYDHLAWRDLADEPWYSTITTLATAAAATTTLRLGTWVTSPNFRHPVVHAKDLMSLDEIAGGDLDTDGKGRIIAALGAGGLGWDSAVLGQPNLEPKQRVDRLTEFVTITDLLLTQPETTWHGEYFSAEKARMYPPGSRARICLVVAGNGLRSVRLASGYDGWATTGPEQAATADEWWDGVAALAKTFERAIVDRGSVRGSRNRYLSMDQVPGYSLADVQSFTGSARRAQSLGFPDLVIHWPRPGMPYAGDERVLDGIAELLVDGQYFP